jgi:shikimate dehydrogenase
MSAFVPASVYGIIGYPLGHTLSPLLHTTAFKELGIPAVLVPWPIESERLKRSWRLSVSWASAAAA